MVARRAASDAWRAAARAVAPEATLLAGVEITHPLVSVPLRGIRDSAAREIDGERWPAIWFEDGLADELRLRNVGAIATHWIEQAKGGAGATARLVGILVDTDDTADIEWEQRLSLQSVQIRTGWIVGRIAVPSLRGRPAVLARHDPARSPGLF